MCDLYPKPGPAAIFILAVVAVLAIPHPSWSETGIRLPDTWSYRTGDDRVWADPAFDDGEWKTVSRSRYPEDIGEGIAWFRWCL